MMVWTDREVQVESGKEVVVIRVSRSQLRRLSIVFRKLFRCSKPTGATAVFVADGDGLRVQCLSSDRAVERIVNGEFPQATLAVPFEVLVAMAGNIDSDVVLTPEGKDKVRAEWNDGGVPIRRSFEVASCGRLPETPELRDICPLPRSGRSFRRMLPNWRRIWALILLREFG